MMNGRTPAYNKCQTKGCDLTNENKTCSDAFTVTGYLAHCGCFKEGIPMNQSDSFIGKITRANLGDQLKRNSQHRPDQVAIVYYPNQDERVVITYRELNARVNTLASKLRAYGIVKGSKVSMMSGNNPSYAIAIYACLKLGAVFSGVNTRFCDDEIVSQIELCESAFFIMDEDNKERIVQIANRLRFVSNFFILGGSSSSSIPNSWCRINLSDFDEHAADPEVDVDEDDVAFLLYTSGSESKAKAAIIPHRNYLMGSVFSASSFGGHTQNDIFLCTLPLYSTAGTTYLITMTQLGGALILANNASPQHLLGLIATEHVTYITHTTTFYLNLLQIPDFDHYDLTSLRICTVFGGGVTKEMLERYKKAAPGLLWSVGWGQTELTGTGCQGFFSSLDEIPEGDLSWVGTPAPTLEIKLVDENMNESTIGEAVCRAPHVMRGYYNNNELNQKVFKNGWLHTGDILRVNHENQHFFVDRIKDIIKSGGFTVSSSEVEAVLNSHPDVLRSAVVAMSDAHWGEMVVAAIVVKENRKISEEELTRFCKNRIASYKVPKQFHFFENLPVDGAGKVKKKAIKSQLLAR